MNTQPRKSRLVFLILPSFLITLAAIVFVIGLNNTPSDTEDSLGRKMGFNDRLSREHYRIILLNFEPSHLLSPKGLFDWVLLLHVGGAFVLLRQKVSLRATFCYFAMQPMCPFWIFGVFGRPDIFKSMIRGTMDREGIIDIPFVWVTSHPVWVLTSIVIASLLLRDLRSAGIDWWPHNIKPSQPKVD